MSPPTDQHQLFYENATMSPFILSEDIVYTATSNNWIGTGSTRSSCYRIRDGGVNVTFSGEQTLYGSYGGTEGKTVGPTSALAYGFYIIDVCQQSPLLIQFLTTTPFPVLSSSTQSSTIMFWVMENPKASVSLHQIHTNPKNTD